MRPIEAAQWVAVAMFAVLVLIVVVVAIAAVIKELRK